MRSSESKFSSIDQGDKKPVPELEPNSQLKIWVTASRVWIWSISNNFDRLFLRSNFFYFFTFSFFSVDEWISSPRRVLYQERTWRVRSTDWWTTSAEQSDFFCSPMVNPRTATRFVLTAFKGILYSSIGMARAFTLFILFSSSIMNADSGQYRNSLK